MSSVIDLLNETNNCEKWKVDEDTSKFFTTVQALNYDKYLGPEVDKYLKYNHQLLIEKIFNGELVRCNRHDIPRLAKRHAVSEELIEKVLSIRSRNEYCVYQAYAGIMEDIYNVYINYIEGKDSIESIVKMLEDYRYKCNYFKYRILDQKLSISLFLDNYELLLLDSDSDYKCDSGNECDKIVEAMEILKDFKFLCSSVVSCRKDAIDLFEEVAANWVNLGNANHDLEPLKFVYSEILIKRGGASDVYREQAELSYVLYNDIICELDCIGTKIGSKVTIEDIKSFRWNGIDESLVKLDSRYLYKIIDGAEIPIWYVHR